MRGWRDLKVRLLQTYAGPVRAMVRFVCRAYRACLLRHVRFIAVTGSCGKTTTKHMIHAALSARLRGTCTAATANHFGAVARLMLRTRPWHRYCVAEFSATQRGDIALLADLFRPDVGVLTVVGTDHYRVFRGPEGVAREKAALVEALPARGIAILNLDDPHVAAMRVRARSRVVSFGMGAAADVRGENVTARWPGTLKLDVVSGTERVPVETRLLGEAMAACVLAAMAVARELGVPWARAAAGIRGADPVAGRLSAHATSSGITIVRDEAKASVMSVPPALQLLREATASRRVLVMGTLSDYGSDAKGRYRRMAALALESAEVVHFVGHNAHLAAKVVAEDGRTCGVWPDAQSLARHLRGDLRAGDLVLLKASRSDHLERLALMFERDVRCWRMRCGIRQPCDVCRHLTTPGERSPAGTG